MPSRRTTARSTYFKRLDDGRYEVGFIIAKGSDRPTVNQPAAIVGDSISAFWWCQIN